MSIESNFDVSVDYDRLIDGITGIIKINTGCNNLMSDLAAVDASILDSGYLLYVAVDTVRSIIDGPIADVLGRVTDVEVLFHLFQSEEFFDLYRMENGEIDMERFVTDMLRLISTQQACFDMVDAYDEILDRFSVLLKEYANEFGYDSDEYSSLFEAASILKALRNYTKDYAYFMYFQYADFEELSKAGRIAKYENGKFYDINGNLLTDVSDIEAAVYLCSIGMGQFANSEFANTYMYLTDEEKKVVLYLINTGRFDQLADYFGFKEEYANQRQGQEKAEEILEKIRGYYANADTELERAIAYARALALLAVEGFTDGLGNFFAGLANLFNADGVVSADQFKAAFLLEGLKEFFDEGSLAEIIATGTYEITSSIGNMVLPMLVGLLTRCPKLGTALMGLSAAGNAREQGLQAGMTEGQAWVFGILVGASEAALGHVLGGIPGLSNMAGKGFLGALLSEGLEESVQAILEPIFEAVVTGMPVDINWDEVIKSGIYGIITAGLMNGGQIVIGGVTYMIDGLTEAQLRYLLETYKDENFTDPDVLANLQADLEKYGYRLADTSEVNQDTNTITDENMQDGEIESLTDLETIEKNSEETNTDSSNGNEAQNYEITDKNGNKLILNTDNKLAAVVTDSSSLNTSNSLNLTNQNKNMSNVTYDSNPSSLPLDNNASLDAATSASYALLGLNTLNVGNAIMSTGINLNTNIEDNSSSNSYNIDKKSVKNDSKQKKEVIAPKKNSREVAQDALINQLENEQNYDVASTVVGVGDIITKLKDIVTDANKRGDYYISIPNDVIATVRSFSENQVIQLLKNTIGDSDVYALVSRCLDTATFNDAVEGLLNDSDINNLLADSNMRFVLDLSNRCIENNQLMERLVNYANNKFVGKLIEFTYGFDGGNLIQFLDNSRIDDMIADGTLKYDSSYPNDVQLIFFDFVNSKVDMQFALANDGSRYGINQGVLNQSVSFVVNNKLWIDKKNFANFIYDKYKNNDGFSLESAKSIADRITTVGSIISGYDYNLLTEFFAKNNSMSSLKINMILKKSFDRVANQTYMNLFNKYVSKGIDPLVVGKILDCIDTTGACSYTNVLNIIFDNYKNDPAAFERDFGFKLYVEENGQLKVNEMEMLADMYIFANSVENGGRLFKNYNGKIKLVNSKIDTSNQIYMSYLVLQDEIINKYLASKNSNVSINSTSFERYGNNSVSAESTAGVGEIDYLKRIVVNALLEGKNVSLSFFPFENKSFNLYDVNGKLQNSTSKWDTENGHAVYVTGITDTHLIISSWGAKYLIPLTDFAGNKYGITVSELKVENGVKKGLDTSDFVANIVAEIDGIVKKADFPVNVMFEIQKSNNLKNKLAVLNTEQLITLVNSLNVEYFVKSFLLNSNPNVDNVINMIVNGSDVGSISNDLDLLSALLSNGTMSSDLQAKLLHYIINNFSDFGSKIDYLSFDTISDFITEYQNDFELLKKFISSFNSKTLSTTFDAYMNGDVDFAVLVEAIKNYFEHRFDNNFVVDDIPTTERIDAINDIPVTERIDAIDVLPATEEVIDLEIMPSDNSEQVNLFDNGTVGAPSMLANLMSMTESDSKIYSNERIVLENKSKPALGLELLNRKLRNSHSSINTVDNTIQVGNKNMSNLITSNLGNIGSVNYNQNLGGSDSSFVGFSETGQYGIDQGSVTKNVRYTVKAKLNFDYNRLVNFIRAEYNSWSYNSIIELTNRIISPGSVLKFNEMKTVIKFLSDESGLPTSQVIGFVNQYFTRSNGVEYNRVLGKLMATGTDCSTAVKILDCINTVGVCTYSDVANLILDYYKDSPAAFERDFGFKLFIDIDGKRVINEVELLADMYIYMNSDICGGSLFKYNNGSYSIVNGKINTIYQQQLSNGFTKAYEVSLINKYLQSKSPNLFIETDSFTCDIGNSIPLEEFKNRIYNAFLTGHKVSLAFLATENRSFNMYQDGKLQVSTSGASWKTVNGGYSGHAVYVTGITDTDLIVSSWGQRYLIPLTDFVDNSYGISISRFGNPLHDMVMFNNISAVDIANEINDSIRTALAYGRNSIDISDVNINKIGQLNASQLSLLLQNVMNYTNLKMFIISKADSSVINDAVLDIYNSINSNLLFDVYFVKSLLPYVNSDFYATLVDNIIRSSPKDISLVQTVDTFELIKLINKYATDFNMPKLIFDNLSAAQYAVIFKEYYEGRIRDSQFYNLVEDTFIRNLSNEQLLEMGKGAYLYFNNQTANNFTNNYDLSTALSLLINYELKYNNSISDLTRQLINNSSIEVLSNLIYNMGSLKNNSIIFKNIFDSLSDSRLIDLTHYIAFNHTNISESMIRTLIESFGDVNTVFNYFKSSPTFDKFISVLNYLEIHNLCDDNYYDADNYSNILFECIKSDILNMGQISSINKKYIENGTAESSLKLITKLFDANVDSKVLKMVIDNMTIENIVFVYNNLDNNYVSDFRKIVSYKIDLKNNIIEDVINDPENFICKLKYDEIVEVFDTLYKSNEFELLNALYRALQVIDLQTVTQLYKDGKLTNYLSVFTERQFSKLDNHLRGKSNSIYSQIADIYVKALNIRNYNYNYNYNRDNKYDQNQRNQSISSFNSLSYSQKVQIMDNYMNSDIDSLCNVLLNIDLQTAFNLYNDGKLQSYIRSIDGVKLSHILRELRAHNKAQLADLFYNVYNVKNNSVVDNSFVAISDFHGFAYPLEKIKNYYLDEYDVVYILGDATDRGNSRDGTGSIKLLLDIMDLSKKYPGRVKYVPGNHDEFLIGYVVNRNMYERSLRGNGGEGTIRELEQLKRNDPRRYSELINWLSNLPIQATHNYNGQDYVLAHALFNQNLYNLNPNYCLNDYFRDNSDSHRMAKDVLWYRKSNDYYNSYEMPSADKIMIIGHTPEKYRRGTNIDVTDSYGRAVKVYCVDGGVAYGEGMLKYDGGSDVLRTEILIHRNTSNKNRGLRASKYGMNGEDFVDNSIGSTNSSYANQNEQLLQNPEIYRSDISDLEKNDIYSKVNAIKDEYFSSKCHRDNDYGVNQALTQTQPKFRINNAWSCDNFDSFVHYIESSYNISSDEAKRLALNLTGFNSGTVISLKDYNTVVKFLTRGGYTTSQVLNILNNSFTLVSGNNYYRIYNKMLDKGISEDIAAEILDCINTTGVCSYAAVANAIISNYVEKFGEVNFEKDFGFSLYVNNDGKEEINSIELLVDLYTYINSDICGGSLFKYNNGKLSLVGSSIDTRKQVSIGGIDDLGNNYFNGHYINQYLASKNSNLSFEYTYKYYGPEDSIHFDMEDLKSLVLNAILNGKQVGLGVYKSSNNVVTFRDSNGNIRKSTKTWSDGNGHDVFITGITTDGTGFIVSSLGERCIIPIRELVNNKFDIWICDILRNETSVNYSNNRIMSSEFLKESIGGLDIKYNVILNSIVKKFGKKNAHNLLELYSNKGILSQQLMQYERILQNIPVEYIQRYLKNNKKM